LTLKIESRERDEIIRQSGEYGRNDGIRALENNYVINNKDGIL
jgi:hypothetical protein